MLKIDHTPDLTITLGNEDNTGDFGGLDGLPTSILYTPSGEMVGRHQGILTQN